MKLNNKGFAISSIMYIILILAVVLVALTLAILSSRKLILDKLKGEVTNTIYGAHPYTYRETLNILKEEAIMYATANNITNDSIKISNFESSIDEEIINDYKLNDKYLTIKANNGSYDVYLGKTKTITDISKNTTKFIDIVDYKISGNSYQQTYTGKNLFDSQLFLDNAATLSDDGSYYFENAYYGDGIVLWENNEGYEGAITISYKVKYGSPTARGLFLLINYEDETKEEVWGQFSETYINVLKTIPSDKKIVNIELEYGTRDVSTNFLNLQIEKGSTATSYEPYVGGMASPNTDYPQEIESVGHYDEEIGKYKIPVEVSGKNLLNPNLILDGNKVLNGITWTRENGIITATGTATADSVYNIWNYNIGFDTSPLAQSYTEYNDLFSVSLCTDNEDTNKFYIRSITTGSNYANEYNNIGRYAVRFSITIPAGSTVENQVFKPMIVHTGNDNIIDNDYEPYIEPVTTNIYIDEPLRKIDKYSDSIEFSTKKIIRNIKEVYATNLKWSYRSDYNLFVVATSDGITRNDLGTYASYATHYSLYDGQFGVMPDKHFHHPSNWWRERSYFVIKDTSYTDATSFKNYLKENNVMLDYILATKEEKETTELPKINTKNESSIIEIDTDIAPTNVEFTVVEKIKQL